MGLHFPHWDERDQGRKDFQATLDMRCEPGHWHAICGWRVHLPCVVSKRGCFHKHLRRWVLSTFPAWYSIVRVPHHAWEAREKTTYSIACSPVVKKNKAMFMFSNYFLSGKRVYAFVNAGSDAIGQNASNIRHDAVCWDVERNSMHRRILCVFVQKNRCLKMNVCTFHSKKQNENWFFFSFELQDFGKTTKPVIYIFWSTICARQGREAFSQRGLFADPFVYFIISNELHYNTEILCCSVHGYQDTCT